MNLAKFSANLPKRSESAAIRPSSGRRTSLGTSRRPDRLSAAFSGRRTVGRRSRLSGFESLRGLSMAAPDPVPAQLAVVGAARGVPPVLGQQVVEQVVDRDGAEQATVVVDDRSGHQVVGGQVARHVLEAGGCPETLGVGVEGGTHEGGRRLPQQPLDVGDADQSTGRWLERRTDDVHNRGQ
jgi:hypothetical protein